jgi:hypothetical protein
LIQLKLQHGVRPYVEAMGRNASVRRLAIMLAAAALAACGTVPIQPPAEDAPLFKRIDAHVGTAYASEARRAYVTNPLMRIDTGHASVTRFEKAFAAMFAETVPLPDWPPWRHERPRVDAVIELEQADAELLLGDDRNRPDAVRITYRVCLYEPDGKEIRCWTTSAHNSHQRAIGECLDLRECIVPQVEVAMREAVALFLVGAEGDAAAQAWAKALRAKGARQ